MRPPETYEKPIGNRKKLSETKRKSPYKGRIDPVSNYRRVTRREGDRRLLAMHGSSHAFAAFCSQLRSKGEFVTGAFLFQHAVTCGTSRSLGISVIGMRGRAPSR